MGTLRITARFEDIAGEATPVRDATIKVISVATKSMEGRGRQIAEEVAFANTGRLASMERPIKYALAYLLACTSLSSSPVDVDKSLRSLAAASDMESVEALVIANAEKLTESVCEVRTRIMTFFEPPPNMTSQYREGTSFSAPQSPHIATTKLPFLNLLVVSLKRTFQWGLAGPGLAARSWCWRLCLRCVHK